MSNRLRSISSLPVAVLSIAVLAACGGGGNSDGGTDPTPAADTVPVGGSLVTAVGPTTYVAGSDQARAFAQLNAVRLAAGAGVLQQSPQLDIAATAHGKYLQTNQTISHTEEPGKPEFYAVTHTDRAERAGYHNGLISEVIGGMGAVGTGADCTNGLLNTVYHGEALLLGGWTDVGIGTFLDSAGGRACVMNPGRKSTHGQVVPAGSVVTYPVDGSTVDGTFYVGYESPRPPIALFPNLTAGSPVIISIRNADFINMDVKGKLDATINALSLRSETTGNFIPVQILVGAKVRSIAGPANVDDKLLPGTIIMVPKSPLPAGAYTVFFVGQLADDEPNLIKGWTFTARQSGPL